MAHQLPRDAGSVPGSEELPAQTPGSPRSCQIRQYGSGGLSESPGGSALASSLQTGASDPPVVPAETPVSQSDVYPWDSESGSRPAVEAGTDARGMETSPRGGEALMRKVRAHRRGPVCVSRDYALSSVVFPDTPGPTRAGRHGTRVAKAAVVRFSPSRSAPGDPGEGPSGWHSSAVSSAVLADPSMVLELDGSPGRTAMTGTSEERPAVPGGGPGSSPLPRPVAAVGLAPEGAQYLDAGLTAGTVETLLSSRAPSTRRMYGIKWKVFATWCRTRMVDPVTCPVAQVLEFLQDRFSAGLSPSTLKVYVAAISASHLGPYGGS